jgi:UDP-N-acetylmuramate: L-alanyl-gamma-D-glutamyl-meso-diaminopimelate ligase
LSKKEHVHLIGIGGTGMTALAGLLHESGCRVTGSDGPLYPPTSTILGELGLTVHDSFHSRNLRPAPDLVVIGNAISRGNAELEEVLDRDLDYTSMPRLIGERFLRKRHSIVVAGTHGKTTTSAMLAWVLAQAGREPGFLIGGQPKNARYPFAVGRGPAFVIEGDEYDTAFFDKAPKFMHYRPHTAVLGTVEYDHADIYADLEQVKTAFRRFVNLVPRAGLLVRHEDCAVTREISDRAPCRVEGFGLAEGLWRAVSIDVSRSGGTTFEVARTDRNLGTVELRTGGEHNVRNALSVIAAASEQGLSPGEIFRGLATFEGVRRRQEIVGEAGGVTIFDDFAHHPTAIRATLEAVRGRYPRARIWAVLEPRSWSLRRNTFQRELAEVFDSADEVVVTEVYRANDVPEGVRFDVPRLIEELKRRGRAARYLPDVASIVSWLVSQARPNDVVVVLSNGGFGGLHRLLLEALSVREQAAQGS